MDPRKNPDSRPADDTDGEGPVLEQQDRDVVETGAITPDSLPENGDFDRGVEESGDAPEEDDDNAYQNSDEALPDDGQEAAISRNPAREGGRFDDA